MDYLLMFESKLVLHIFSMASASIPIVKDVTFAVCWRRSKGL
ncbi:MAG: hypothetical protein JETT_0573 [Candidatus Jettenia ecosi]|uniref:Uncharacterized protein n=1 Tax=Candidatus Jettenia ecosi TaxID=2494326 RepID=A0A533QEG9_9BACT|nr:MAG: hypothetical protein JETT_0573 [Candidatus Jettenia ecosi]